MTEQAWRKTERIPSNRTIFVGDVLLCYGVRNRAGRGQCVCKVHLFLVDELLKRDTKFEFPVHAVWLVASAGECSSSEPGEGSENSHIWRYSSI